MANTTIKEKITGYARWHIKNPAESGTADGEWSKGFNQGYEAGRMALIEELLGIIEMERIRKEVYNE